VQNLRSLLRQNRGFLLFLLLVGFVRTAIADYNPIPSGSMHPNILEGDVVLVNRLAYDLKLPLTDIVLARLGDPQRGDIVTFHSPADDVRLIKRVIGLPGDTVAMRDKRLTINGVDVSYAAQGVSVDGAGGLQEPRAQRQRETLGGRAHDIQWLDGVRNAPDFGPLRLPQGQYLMLGDNRDNSADSRYIGLVPRALLIGRAERVLVSVAMLERWQPRFERFGRSLNP